MTSRVPKDEQDIEEQKGIEEVLGRRGSRKGRLTGWWGDPD